MITEAPPPAASASTALLSVRDLALHYRTRRGARSERVVRAVDGVSFSIEAGEILALVGESGCGKTSIVRAISHLERPTAGEVVFKGQDVTRASSARLRQLRRQIQVVFQDPFESLDPRLTASDTVAESLVIHGIGAGKSERWQMTMAVLDQVGLRPPELIAERYPHQLSGGQRQRVVIAGAMVLEPDLVIADEPVSMLDVSLRAGILKLMLDLREARGVSFLFVTHDLSLAWVVADRIAVVYLGRIVEMGPTLEVIRRPRHPYSQALVSVIPVPERAERRQRKLLAGETPSAARVPAGCRFRPRCPLYLKLGEPAACRDEDPHLEAAPGNAGHAAACHFADTEEATS